MTTKEQISALESQQLELHAIMRSTDAHALKCNKEGLSYKDTYPDEYAEYMEANAQYNINETMLAQLQADFDAAQKAVITEDQVV